MALVNFKKGLLANLPATKTAGTFYVTTDERAMYLDVDASTRIRLGDFQEFATVEALTGNANPNTSALYYVTDINCLAKWNGSEYIQINKDTGMTSVEVTGEGNAITAAVYDAAGRKLTLTKGATYMTAADVDGKISDKVGTLKIGDTTYDTVVAYVNKKAEDTLSAAQGGSSETAASVKQALDNYKTENDAKVQANTDAIKAIQDDYLKDTDKQALQASIDEKAAQSDLTALENKVGTVPTDKTVVGLISEAKTQADKGVADAATAQAAADTAQADVDALEGKVGTVPDGKTVVQMIADAQTAATYDDSTVKASIKAIADDYLKATDKTELQGNIDTVSNKVTTLIGSVEGDDGKSARTIASEEVAKIVAGADTAYDTLKEISDWISSHKDDASAMNSAILALEGIVDGIGGEGEKATVVAYVTDAIAALNIGDYAKAADLTALAARVTTVEGQIATLNGDESTAGSVKKALADAKAYTDGKDSAMEIRVQALETDTHTHANKAELDKIEAGDKAKWDAAQANAEATAATALSSAKTELEGKITAAQTAAEGKVTELANGAVKANTDAIATINGTGDGSFAKADATLKTQLEAYADQAESDAVATAKAYTDSLLEWGSF